MVITIVEASLVILTPHFPWFIQRTKPTGLVSGRFKNRNYSLHSFLLEEHRCEDLEDRKTVSQSVPVLAFLPGSNNSYAFLQPCNHLSKFFSHKYIYNVWSIMLLHNFILCDLAQNLLGLQVFLLLTPNLCNLSNFFSQKSCYKSFQFNLKTVFLIRCCVKTVKFTALQSFCWINHDCIVSSKHKCLKRTNWIIFLENSWAYCLPLWPGCTSLI